MANPSRTGGNRPENTGAGTTPHFATDVKNRAQETASDLASQAKNTAANLADQAKTTASAVADKAQNLASNVGQRAQDAASNLGHKADDARSAVGGQMKSLASTLRDNVAHEGVTGQAASAVAQGLEGAGSYLQQHGFGDMADDLGGVIRRYPIPSVLIGIGVGFLLAKATRS